MIGLLFIKLNKHVLESILVFGVREKNWSIPQNWFAPADKHLEHWPGWTKDLIHNSKLCIGIWHQCPLRHLSICSFGLQPQDPKLPRATEHILATILIWAGFHQVFLS